MDQDLILAIFNFNDRLKKNRYHGWQNGGYPANPE
jgi:hypothetical protein